MLRRLSHSRTVRRAALVALLPFAGVLTAFGIAPGTATETEMPVVTTVVEDVQLTPVVVASTDEETYWREERIERGDTIGALLARLHIEDAHAVKFLRDGREAQGLRQLIPGKMVRARTSEHGRLLELRYTIGVMMLTVRPQGDGFRVGEEVAPLERRIVMRSGDVKSSLFAAIDAAQLNDAIAGQLADIFSGDIDFHKDVRAGDRFTVIYEMYFSGGEPVQSGRVLAAEFVNAGNARQAIWFQHPNGQGDYYAPDGRSIRKAFLRSPLEYSRISSGFMQLRFHPILERWRAHKGIDYAAPAGSGVKASADGVVETAGYDSGYGNFVVLRHEQKYTTLYGHLSGFARGVSRGARVSQGQVIGYVGSTGLATGPHLHYEFRINDVYQDPLTVATAEAPPITPELRAKFDIAARPIMERLALVRHTRLARLN
ncbi:MAG TPA: peptidoglycan DD-metalloendopeptidase family protein [Burkholderiales bacterium]|nr:peptidoglycan DD-metalloendopeptidase family protein [Burkholderiales bacterium]